MLYGIQPQLLLSLFAIIGREEESGDGLTDPELTIAGLLRFAQPSTARPYRPANDFCTVGSRDGKGIPRIRFRSPCTVYIFPTISILYPPFQPCSSRRLFYFQLGTFLIRQLYSNSIRPLLSPPDWCNNIIPSINIRIYKIRTVSFISFLLRRITRTNSLICGAG